MQENTSYDTKTACRRGHAAMDQKIQIQRWCRLTQLVMSVDAPIASSQSETRTPIANLFVHSARALPLTPMLPKKQIQRPIAIISGNQSLSRYGQKAFRKTERDAKYYPRIWRFRASKLSWLKSCSIRQASAEAVSGETPRSTSHWLISV